MKAPTTEECDTNAAYSGGDLFGFAAWYPQMGGYVGKCWVLSDGSAFVGDEPPCFDVYVWHNGEFPIFEDSVPNGPKVLHHCAAEQFIAFGELVKREFGGTR